MNQEDLNIINKSYYRKCPKCDAKILEVRDLTDCHFEINYTCGTKIKTRWNTLYRQEHRDFNIQDYLFLCSDKSRLSKRQVNYIENEYKVCCVCKNFEPDTFGEGIGDYCELLKEANNENIVSLLGTCDKFEIKDKS